MSDFVHLHLHTQYSLLDGAITIDRLCQAVKSYEMPAVAITDHGNLFGGVEFYQAALKKGIKPILGCEVYIQSQGSRFDKKMRRGHEPYHHLTLLASDLEGYRNLCRLITAGYLEGFYFKPRIDKELLRAHSKGLIVLSGCLSGELADVAVQEGVAGARRVVEDFQRTFGDRFYLEVQGNSLADQKKVNDILFELSKDLSIPAVATNDCHYLHRSDAPAHEALLCIQTGKTLQDEDRMRFSSDDFYLRSPEEMLSIFSDHPESLQRSVEIASRCHLELDFKTYYFPKFEPPQGKTLDDYLEGEVWKFFEDRWAIISKNRIDEEKSKLRRIYEERLRHELAMIKKMGFSGYFLIVADFINYAKSQNIPVGPGRGSAAGSLVAFCLKITDLDPIPYNLLFERFLNPERISMPDMDIDFCMNRRDEVIRYVQQKYGNVGQIITFGKMKAKAVIRDVGRVMNMPYGEVDKIAKLVPNTLNITLEEALRQEPRLKELENSDPRVKKLVSFAKSLEGLTRHASTHAAGIVISDQPLINFMPLYKGQNDEIVSQYDMKAVEKIGLIKFDFLGLKTLTVIDDAIKIVRRTHGEEIRINEIPTDDPKVYETLSAGDTMGIFQLESSGMRELIIKMKPSAFPDLIALVALYRPGPLGSGMVDEFINRKHGRVSVKYELPQLKALLEETYGVIVYQEQVMQIASALASFSLGDADLLRRAMGKKKPEEMAQQKEKFLKGCEKNSVPMKKAEKIFDLMEKFAEYGFNKCVVAETELYDAQTGETFTVADLLGEGPRRFTLACDKAYQLVPRRIISITSNGPKRVFRLTTSLGHEILATANHPFMTIEGWKPLEMLACGTRIAVPRILPLAGKLEMPSHEVITLAWLLSEGNLCHPSSLYFYNNDSTVIEDFVQAVEKFPHTKARVTQRSDGRFEVCVNTGTRSHVPWNAASLAALQKERPPRSGAYRWAEHLGLIGKKADQKLIPTLVFRMTEGQIALFLGRLWSGDGFVFGPRNSVPFYATASKSMARQVQSLLLRLGIPSRCVKKSFRYRKGVKTGYAVYVTGEEASSTLLERIGPFMVGREDVLQKLRGSLKKTRLGRASRDTIPWEVKRIVREEKIRSGRTWKRIEQETELSMKEFIGGEHIAKKGFRRKIILELGRYFGSEILQNLGRSDLYWDRVDRIMETGVQETYDLEIEEDHNFVANGIIVHNSHSAAYAFISYQTAYLKTHDTVEYMASLLTHEMGNTDKVIAYIQDCRDHGIAVLPPDINECFSGFSVVGPKEIRFGLAAVKNVGVAAIESIIESRKRIGKFNDFQHFCQEIDLRKVNRRVLESLIKCGAFDSMGIKRSHAFHILEQVVEMAAKVQRDRERGQSSLFGTSAATVSEVKTSQLPEWTMKEQLSFEKESLGFYITGHPLTDYIPFLKTKATSDTASLSDVDKSGEFRESRDVSLGGVVSSLREVVTKKGDRMGFVTIEDLKGTVSVIIFPDVYRQSNAVLKSDEPVFIRGSVESGEEGVKIIAREVIALKQLMNSGDIPALQEVHFHVPASLVTKQHLEKMKGILQEHQGEAPAYLHLIGLQGEGKRETVLKLPEELKVAPSEALMREVDQLFGTPVTLLP